MSVSSAAIVGAQASHPAVPEKLVPVNSSERVPTADEPPLVVTGSIVKNAISALGANGKAASTEDGLGEKSNVVPLGATPTAIGAAVATGPPAMPAEEVYTEPPSAAEAAPAVDAFAKFGARRRSSTGLLVDAAVSKPKAMDEDEPWKLMDFLTLGLTRVKWEKILCPPLAKE